MLKNYLLLAFKVLLRRKFFTFVSLFGISLTLATLLIVMALMDILYNPPPPEVFHDRTLMVQQMTFVSPDRENRVGGTGSYLVLDKCVRPLVHAGVGVERITISAYEQFSSYPAGKKLLLRAKYADAEFWKVFQFTVLAGAPFTADDVHNAAMVAVINQKTREQYFGTSINNEAACGKIIEAEGQRFRVVAVVENAPISTFANADIVVPLTTIKSQEYKTSLTPLRFIGVILADHPHSFPGIKAAYRANLDRFQFPDPKQFNAVYSYADTELESEARNINVILGRSADWKQDDHSTDTSLLLGLIIVAIFLFMTLPAINLINLNVSRILERSSEIGVRRAFGASRRTLIGQFVVENLVLVFVGAGIGMLIAMMILYTIEHSGWLVASGLTISWRVFLYGIFTVLVFSLMSGLYPAWKMSRLHTIEALKGGHRV